MTIVRAFALYSTDPGKGFAALSEEKKIKIKTSLPAYLIHVASGETLWLWHVGGKKRNKRAKQ